MRVAALYDIHGNLPALDAVLSDIARDAVDLIVVGGDVVPGPLPRETLQRLLALERPTRFIRGNGDREVLARIRGIETDTVPPQFVEVLWWSARQLGPEAEAVLAGWEPTLQLRIAGIGNVLFCHATPDSDTEIFTRVTPDERLLPVFEAVEANLVVCGHTHMQFDRTVGRTRVVNAGSVGMPFGEPGAYWLRLGPEIELRRTEYDVRAAAEVIRASAYPQAADFAERNVLRPPSEEDMLRLFNS